MVIDVEICGQLLIAWRREEHLENVAACIKVRCPSHTKRNYQIILGSYWQSRCQPPTSIYGNTTNCTRARLANWKLDHEYSMSLTGRM